MKKITLSLVLILCVLFVFGQLDITKRKVTLDSINARGAAVYINDDVVVKDTTLQDYIGKYSAATSGAAGFDGEVQLALAGVLSSDFNFSWDGNALYLSSGIGLSNIFIGEGSGFSTISGGYNTAIGAYTGYDINTATNNSLFGYNAGGSLVSGNDNTFIGNQAGNAANGSDNVFVGYNSGSGSFSGLQNTFLGSESGRLNNGSGNMFLGYQAGYNESGSNKLYIENTNSATPLIYGEFDNDLIQINGSLEVSESLTLGGTSGESEEEGKVYYDTISHTLTYFNDVSKHRVDYEQLGRFYNNLGETITKGTALTPVGIVLNGVVTPSAIYAGNGSKDSLNLIALASADVLPGEFGNVLLIGALEFYNTSAFNDNDLIYVGKGGLLTNVEPEPPYFSLPIGKCFYADNDSGVIYMLPQGVAKYNPTPVTSVSFSRELETIINPGINTPALITNVTNDLYTNDYSVGFTLQGDTVSPLQDGVYLISANFAYQGDASSADDWRVGVFKNGIEQFSVLRTTSSSNKGVVGLSKIVSLVTTDWISFKIENTSSATRDAVFTDGVVNIEFITEP